MEIKDIASRLKAPYYTRKNLELILGFNRRTLDYRIETLLADKVLARIKPGFYLNNRLINQSTAKAELLEYVGFIAKYPAYVSLEYALAKYGLIPESIFAITYITTKKTGEYSCPIVTYKYRNLKTSLFSDYETRVIAQSEYKFATKYKALFDLIYLTPLKSQTAMIRLLFDSRINWQVLSSEDKKKFIQTCQQSQSIKMSRVIQLLTRRNIL